MDWTRHLTARLEELSVPYEELDLSEGILNIGKEPEKGVYYNRMSASSSVQFFLSRSDRLSNLFCRSRMWC